MCGDGIVSHNEECECSRPSDSALGHRCGGRQACRLESVSLFVPHVSQNKSYKVLLRRLHF